MHRDGVRITFNHSVHEFMNPIPGTKSRGSVLKLFMIWDWAEFMRIASKHFLIPIKGCEYDFESCDELIKSDGYKNMNYSPISNETRAYSRGGKHKGDRLTEIPLSVPLITV